jgi:hypothetical protein
MNHAQLNQKVKVATRWKKGQQILWLRHKATDIELYARFGEVEHVWIVTKGSLCKPLDAGEVYDDFEESMDENWETLIETEIIDVDPAYAEKIGQAFRTVVDQNCVWDFAEAPKWSWSWQRTYHFGIAIPGGLHRYSASPEWDADEIIGSIEGWHAAMETVRPGMTLVAARRASHRDQPPVDAPPLIAEDSHAGR